MPVTESFYQPPVDAGHRPVDWAEPGLGPRWHHRFFYLLMRHGGKVRGYHMANIASLWYVLFYPSIRRRCSFYLDRRFPVRRGFVRRFFDTYRLVRSYAATLVDMMVLSMCGPSAMSASCIGREKLKELAASDRGFVLIHAHVGCWQVGMSTLKQFGKKVSVVMIPEQRTVSLLDPKTTTAIDPRGGVQSSMQMAEAILAGDIVAMMGDRTFGDEHTAVTVDFLGGKVQMPITPYRLASATGVPVVVMTAPKIGAAAYELRLARVIEIPPGLGRRPQAYAPYARQFAECIEHFIEENPWQYYNFFDLWQSTIPFSGRPAGAR